MNSPRSSQIQTPAAYPSAPSINFQPITKSNEFELHLCSFDSNSVQRLNSNAFTLDERMRIGLKCDQNVCVLFSLQDAESQHLLKVWAEVAEQTPGPIFAVCNILLERELLSSFSKIQEDKSHPLYEYSRKGWPSIIAYQNGIPTATYHGEHDVQIISDWVLMVFGRTNYYEPVQIPNTFYE